MERKILKQLAPFLWEIPTAYRPGMLVPARIYTSPTMLQEILADRSLEQLVNVTTLPGIQVAALVMPDVHEGYGFPIGGVAATSYPEGVISPGGIGYDINCGVRLLLSPLKSVDLTDKLDQLAKVLFKVVPAGVGRGGFFRLSEKEFTQVLVGGAKWVVEQGKGEADDLEHLESGGKISGADPDAVSGHARERGKDQLGTLGAGNHFVEVDQVESIFDQTAAKNLGLFLKQIVVLIHTGSRGLGHQVATDYIRLMVNSLDKYGIKLPDRELACAPFSSPEGGHYFAAMAGAANFAFANRQLVTEQVRRAWQKFFGASSGQLTMLYDVAHNIAKIEEYEIKGKRKKLIVHRKGATRAFPGQPVLIPGSMGTASYILLGTQEALKQSFGSTCHGAGRRMSRTQARREINAADLKHELKERGIRIEAGSLKGIAEEAPQAYKDIDQVVEVVAAAGLATKVARLRPLIVIKG